jgi:hypothetical protein
VASLDGMSIKDVIDMLNDTDDLEEQASLVHYLWMKRCAPSRFALLLSLRF